jgi:hypothetical protein
MGLRARRPKKLRITTDSIHDQPVAQNALERKFEASEPNRRYHVPLNPGGMVVPGDYHRPLLASHGRPGDGQSHRYSVAPQLLDDGTRSFFKIAAEYPNCLSKCRLPLRHMFRYM